MTAMMPDFIDSVLGLEPTSPHALQLDGTKIPWWRDRVEAWRRGERIAPITMDVAWTRRCAAACNFCVFPDSNVLMADGSVKRMIDVKIDDVVASVDEYGRPAISTVSAHLQTSPSMRGLQIETQFGKLKCTANHEILTDSGWVPAGDLRVGDYVYTSAIDRSREATEARAEFTVVGDQPQGRGTTRETTPSQDRVQQDEGGRAVEPGSASARRRAVGPCKQDARASRSGTVGKRRAHAGSECIWENEARPSDGGGAGSHQTEDVGERLWKICPASVSGAAAGRQRPHEAAQSHEGCRDCSQDATNADKKTWQGLLVALVQAPLGRRAHQGATAFREREAIGARAHDSVKSHEGPEGRHEGAQKLLCRAPAGSFGAHETDMAGREDHSGHVYGKGECEGREQDRASIIPDSSISSWPVRRRRIVLDQGHGERDLSQSGLYLRERQAKDGSLSPWNVLASGRGDSASGDRRLSGGRLERLRTMDEADSEMDASADQGGNKIVVGRYRILSITDAGTSPVYDLECRPHHNFVADGIVVHNCYAQLQANEDTIITRQNAFDFLDDAAEAGVKGISLISDGESTEVPFFAESVTYGADLGIQIGTSSNGLKLTRDVLEKILPGLTYLRFNFSGGDKHRWAQIMGMKQALYDRVIDNIKAAMEIKRRDNLPVNINMQFVVMPKDADQIMPFARLAKELRPDYAIMKHCANSADGDLDVDYREYSDLFPLFKEAEALSDETFRVAVKWSRIQDEGKRDYSRCYGPPFILQMSGNGLIAPCGQKFNAKYAKFHIGNITRQRFRDILNSERYLEVMNYLASEEFAADRDCGENCLQTNTNSWLDKYVKGTVSFPTGPAPAHLGFL